MLLVSPESTPSTPAFFLRELSSRDNNICYRVSCLVSLDIKVPFGEKRGDAGRRFSELVAVLEENVGPGYMTRTANHGITGERGGRNKKFPETNFC